ncbi:MAG: HIT domain-containing protein [Gammaproteobacteria bacterium]|nr:HIT domain-containing protein [Gammaproteobacteria bacterium]
MDWYCENIIQGNLDVNKVYESDTVVAFWHTKPFWECHIVAVPRKHIISMASLELDDVDVITEIMVLMSKLAKEFENKYVGCHIGTNVGSHQSTKYLHWYIYAGERIREG